MNERTIFKTLPLGVTFDDVLLVPVRSPVKSRSDVDVKTNLTKKIKLKIPFIPANMDTVTESSMAIAVAHEGSLGIIHRFHSIEREVEEVKKVKRVEDLVLYHPVTLFPNHTLADVLFQIDRYDTRSFLVVDEKNKLLGILTSRDYQFEKNLSTKVSKMMTPVERLITATYNTTLEQAKKILSEKRLEKLPLVYKDGTLAGLYTAKDIIYFESKPNALRDKEGRLMVGASVGVVGDYMERASELVKAEVDLLLVDVAHGHADHTIDAIKVLKKKFPNVQLMGGNIATAAAAKDMIKAGVDSVKVGIGPGSVCTTRTMSGVGVPQLSAVHEVSVECSKVGIPVVADGGAKTPGDIVKALAAGADVVMSGNMFAGTEEAPGQKIVIESKTYKVYHGSSTSETAKNRNKNGDFSKLAKHQLNYVEGAEALVPYKGFVDKMIYRTLGGITSGFSYCGAHTIQDLHKNARFIMVTPTGVKESSFHDVNFARSH
ncbi:IMP dehydrogenase [candidate division WWE3 bacterium RIFCSPHIGHO2_12_FULL_38_15]|uniref:Inosine-5'-monophosphate dehydrogenase n=1 Tax=candidate division WWE3 bacterium RIFCSPHIGHO2_02_FULL_38_14 TaxID=1802620 RepID=A0A1F4V6I5_UNCKA|nr:MAG: IMP dehydrogenase [candidate division WWE3 bacterium RIFCSPHIGHO2_01_FULL_38_45]OGC48845.1 MAG: IMP dehydrogenase [candidate division WWE3 bacterium RIFCSPHIGHO2_12_FULL_38_15]OGC52801.1 MAG: IMP dehydrogenase [candidate division WWE3 bacterium RIFCSPHIGHO2_02_FULL_38_14]OGC53148.1 MAG: IMP dehydrogenase [candidate division WWE3 bacterium RIFCSPLOWO2_01_FULL_37_24]HLB51988.1 IMP dehydrogenase [Patescibacteria group bacterium]